MKASDDAKDCARAVMEVLDEVSCVGCKYETSCDGDTCKKNRKKIAKVIQEAIDKAFSDGFGDGYSDGYDDALDPCYGSNSNEDE